MKLKASLLYEILNSNFPETCKYTKSFYNIKNVIMLEETNKLDKKIKEKFSILEKSFNSFYKNIPLLAIEKYYIRNINSRPANPIYFEFKSNNEIITFELTLIELFMLLEKFFQDVFSLACLLADEYNLEIKIKKDYSNSDNQNFA